MGKKGEDIRNVLSSIVADKEMQAKIRRDIVLHSLKFHYRKADDRYQVTVFFQGRKDIYGKTKEEVADKVIAYWESLDAGGIIVQKMVEQHLWKETKSNVEGTTFDRYENTFIHHIKDTEFGKLGIRDVKRKDCQNFLDFQLKKDLSESSIQKIKQQLCKAFDYALTEELIQFNPMDTVKVNFRIKRKEKASMRIQNGEISIFTKEEYNSLRKIIDYLWQKNKSKKNALAILYCILTGLRIGEVLALKWDNVFPEKERMYVDQTVKKEKERDEDGRCTGKMRQFCGSTKTDSSNRRVWLRQEAIEILEEIKRKNLELNIDSSYVFCSKKGTMISERNMNRMYSQILEMADVPYRNFHMTRSTFVTDLINEGVPIQVVQRWLGHKKATTTLNCYLKFSEKDEENAIRMFKLKSA